MIRHHVPVERVARGKDDADRMRATWRVAMELGRASIEELAHAACHPDGGPLLRLRLVDVLMCSGLGRSAARRALALVRERAGVPDHVPDRELNMAWLLDPRAHPGARQAMFCDAWCAVRGSRYTLVEETGWPWRAVESVG